MCHIWRNTWKEEEMGGGHIALYGRTTCYAASRLHLFLMYGTGGGAPWREPGRQTDSYGIGVNNSASMYVLLSRRDGGGTSGVASSSISASQLAASPAGHQQWRRRRMDQPPCQHGDITGRIIS